VKRFFERIRLKALDVTHPPVLIVAFGDSITQGVMEHNLIAPEIVYHRLLQELLQEFYPTTTFSTINAGVSGDATTAALGRLERDVIQHQPDLVLVAFGTNDSGGGLDALDGFKDNLRQIISCIREQTEADMVLLTPPFMATRESSRIHPEHQEFAASIVQTQTKGVLAGYVEAIRQVAREKQVFLADVYREWVRLSETRVDTNLWLINGLNHPDARGHSLTAQIIFNLLLSVNSQRPDASA
jgi:acyl-CoA thioesterase-1